MTAQIIDFSTWRTIHEWADPKAAERAITSMAAALALDPDLMSDADVTAVLKRWAHPSLAAEERAGYFEDYLDAIRRLAELDSERITWHEVLPHLTYACSDKLQAAREHLDSAANDALSVLLHGLTGGAA